MRSSSAGHTYRNGIERYRSGALAAAEAPPK